MKQHTEDCLTEMESNGVTKFETIQLDQDREKTGSFHIPLMDTETYDIEMSFEDIDIMPTEFMFDWFNDIKKELSYAE